MHRIALVIVLCVATQTACIGGDDPEPAPRPNIVVILTDDQPSLDTLHVMPETSSWFQDDGTDFVQAYVTTPLCCPSRASIMTGLYAHNHGVQVDMQGNASLLDQSLTIQARLREAGYRTAYFGKYLNAWPIDVDPSHLDEWAIFSNTVPSGYRNGEWNVDGEVRRVKRYSTTYIGRRGAAFIEEAEQDDSPWILFLAPAAPHRPYIAEPKYADAPVGRYTVRGEKDTSDKPAYVRDRQVSKEKGLEIRSSQLRTLMSVDDMAAHVRRALIDTGEAPSTLSFFMSDNGYLWGQHGMVGKMIPYTDSIKVPLMMSWPGHVEAGATDERLVANIDVPATIADVAGLRNVKMDGRSLLGSFEREELLLEFWETENRPTWSSLLTPSFQYVELFEDGGATPTFREYYDLTTDPRQLENLLGDDDPTNDPDVEALEQRLAAARRCEVSKCP